jgi:hypothetical protein
MAGIDVNVAPSAVPVIDHFQDAVICRYGRVYVSEVGLTGYPIGCIHTGIASSVASIPTLDRTIGSESPDIMGNVVMAAVSQPGNLFGEPKKDLAIEADRLQISLAS